jgi:FMN-dependent NADH-azoreductase
MNVLNVVANPKPKEEAVSKQLATAFFAALKAQNPSTVVTDVDLYAQPPPFYSYGVYRHFWYPVFDPAYKPSSEEARAAAYAHEQCRLFKQSDVVVLTSPMWNFSLPAILKAWIDQVIMPNQTFSIGAGGVQGLHKVRKVVLLTASGGAYADGDPKDNLSREVRAAFGFMGIADIGVVWAQGQNPFFFKDSAARKAAALADAAALGRTVAAM